MNYPISTILIALVLSISMLHLTSCSDDDVHIPHEEEVITTLNWTLTPDDGGPVVSASFHDPDGDGGIEPTVTGANLQANTTYAGSFELLNETEDPAEDITEEISEEDEEHQFFFSVAGLDLSIDYDDTDSNGNPLGLETTLTTGDSGEGMVTVTLRHEPDKDGSGVSGGDITNAGGETDIEVDFPIEIE